MNIVLLCHIMCIYIYTYIYIYIYIREGRKGAFIAFSIHAEYATLLILFEMDVRTIIKSKSRLADKSDSCVNRQCQRWYGSGLGAG